MTDQSTDNSEHCCSCYGMDLVCELVKFLGIDVNVSSVICIHHKAWCYLGEITLVKKHLEEAARLSWVSAVDWTFK